jgi:hypothetical protein
MAITDQSLLPKHLKVYKSVKTVNQYNYIINVLRKWGDDTVLVNAYPDDMDAAAIRIRTFCKKNHLGYNYLKQYEIEEAQSIDGFPKSILKHIQSGGVVLHMLNVFDVIHKAHGRQGHLKVNKTLANCTPHFYNPTYELCKLFIKFCFICHESHPRVDAQKGAKKPILSSEFCDCFQVDLIDMWTMQKKDVYGRMQRWIMTVKDHLTGLMYLCPLPCKKADYVAAELEKFFGLVGYPSIFHTGGCMYVHSERNEIVVCY